MGSSSEMKQVDLIDRQAAISHVDDIPYIKEHPKVGLLWKAWIESLPSAQPDHLREATKKVDYKTDHGYMWLCPECGLAVHSDYDRCVRCGHERREQ